jgi:DNA-binding transcriptional LysR family regulator
MSLRQMEYLLAVVEEGSFTRAARRLSVSQPALSHQVRALERSVGLPLLERLHDNVRLTPMGRAYLPHAVAALRSAEEAWNAGNHQSPSERISLRVAAVYSDALGIVPPAIRAWQEEYPDGDVEVLEFSNPEDMARRVALGGADVAVGPSPPDWDGPVRELGIDALVVVMAADDPFVAGHGSTVRLAELSHRAWVLYAAENGLAPLVAHECARAGFDPRAAVRTQHPSTALRLAEAGLGPALVPRSIIEADFAGAQFEPAPPVVRALFAITAAPVDKHVSRFIDLLAERGAHRFRRTH